MMNNNSTLLCYYFDDAGVADRAVMLSLTVATIDAATVADGITR